MKISRKKLRKIIQDAVMRQAIAVPRTRGQNDRKGFSSGIYEEGVVEEEESADLTLTEIRREIRSVIQEQSNKMSGIFDVELEGKPGDWKYKIVDSPANHRSLAVLGTFDVEDVSEDQADRAFGDIEMVVSSGKGAGFKFKLKDIKGDWDAHPLARQALSQIADRSGDNYDLPTVAARAGDGEELVKVFASVESNGSGGMAGENYVLPEEFAISPYFPSSIDPRNEARDALTELVSLIYFDIASIEETWNSPEGPVSGNLVTGTVNVGVEDGDKVVVTIPSLAPEAYQVGLELMRAIGTKVSVGDAGVVGVSNLTNESDDDVKLEIYIKNEEGGTIGAEVKNYRQPANGIHRHAFEIVVYRTPDTNIELEDEPLRDPFSAIADDDAEIALDT